MEQGDKLGKLTAVRKTGAVSIRGAQWVVRCECGTEELRFEALLRASIRAGKTPMCAVCAAENRRAKHIVKHGMARTKFYNVWHNIVSRCNNKRNKYYGASNIQVCERWRKSFENFYADMFATYEEGLDIDRIDTTKGYSPDNCRWVSRRENTMNRRVTYVEVDYKQLAKDSGLSPELILNRIHYGWPIDKLTLPPDKTHKKRGYSWQHKYTRKYS